MTKAILAMLSLLLVCTGAAQTPQQPTSVADLARAVKREKNDKKEQTKLVFNEDAPPTPRPLIPDVVVEGFDNSDEILKVIMSYKATHNAQETETVVHAWFDKHVSLMATAQDQNKRIEQTEQDRQLGFILNDSHPRTQQEMLENQRMDTLARRKEARRKQDNQVLFGRVQQALMKIRNSLGSAGLKYEWFKIPCGTSYCY
jgi:hypothetical protein